MSDFVEVDVRGLSCPEPVLLVMDAMDEHPGETWLSSSTTFLFFAIAIFDTTLFVRNV